MQLSDYQFLLVHTFDDTRQSSHYILCLLLTENMFLEDFFKSDTLTVLHNQIKSG